MVQKYLIIIIISFVLITIVSIFTWLIFFSIYEVKYIYNFNPKELNVNSKYCIESVGLNSLGHKISYRDLGFKVTLKQAEDFIQLIGKDGKNKICFETIQSGETSFALSSQYSLNPSLLKITIK